MARDNVEDSELVEFDNSLQKGDNVAATPKAAAPNSPPNMTEKSENRKPTETAPRTEIERFSFDSDVDDVALIARLEIVTSRLREKADEIVDLHAGMASPSLRDRLRDKSYRTRRLSEFLAFVDDDIACSGLPKQSKFVVGKLLFDDIWDKILKSAHREETEQPKARKPFDGLDELPTEPIENFCSSKKEDPIEFLKRVYGAWLERDLIDYKTIKSIDPYLAKKISYKMANCGIRRLDVFASTPVVRENQELFRNGVLSEQTIARRIFREKISKS